MHVGLADMFDNWLDIKMYLVLSFKQELFKVMIIDYTQLINIWTALPTSQHCTASTLEQRCIGSFAPSCGSLYAFPVNQPLQMVAEVQQVKPESQYWTLFFFFLAG